MPWVEIRPEGVVGSAYSEPRVWKVSRQRPMLGRSTAGLVSVERLGEGIWRGRRGLGG
jgi:hypothetical protein